MNHLRYPFDQYQRYRDMREVVTPIAAHLDRERLSILDVGGTALAHDFLAAHHLTTINPEPEGETALQGSGVELPFADGSFDVVITVDTLEHVPTALRAPFVAEMARVAGEFVLITGPFANGYSETAEQILSEFLADVVGVSHRFLDEHLDHGLPHAEACLAWLSKAGCVGTSIPSGYLHHWLPLMIIQQGLSRVADYEMLRGELNELYNREFFRRDHRTPSYRQVIVASKQVTPEAEALLERVAKALAANVDEESLDLNGVVALWQATAVQSRLEAREARVLSLEAENRRLETLVEGYRSGKVMRLLALINAVVSALWERLRR